MDQNAYTFLSYREKIANAKCSKKEIIALSFRLDMRRQERYELVKRDEETKTEALVLDPDQLGEKVTHLIPCLDPSLKKRSNRQKIQRFMPTPVIAQLNADKRPTIDFLASTFPITYQFYPSDAIMKKLILRMVQLKDINDLWHGFHPVVRANGEISYHPDELVDLKFEV